MLDTGYILKNDDYEYRIIEMIGRGANTIAYLADRKHNGLVSKCILKEYSPGRKLTDEEYENGKLRFINSAKTQIEIRQLSSLNNQTPPVSCIFEYISPDQSVSTAFIDVTCYGGNTLSKLKDLSLLQYMKIIRTISRTVGYYHKSGYLCLDVKPENIFIMQNAPDDTITQLVEFIDFDSIRSINGIGSDTVISCTKDWAAPELLNSYSTSTIGPKADIYTIGELVFYYLFGRHSTEREHRGFSKYPYSECKKEYKKFTDRPDIRSLFTQIFRSTVRSSATNRFDDIAAVVKILDALIEALSQKDYVIPKLPAVSPNFIGRDRELKDIADNLKENHVLFLSGIGGIGKSTLIKNFINLKRADYDVIIYIESDGDLRRSFACDIQLQISTVHQTNSESTYEYFERKLKALKSICADRKVLFVIDNYSGKITKDLNLIFDCGYDTVIATRNTPPKNSFNVMTVEAIAESPHLFSLITLNLERPLTKDEHTAFEEIISLVHGHTLTLELIARQISKGRIDINQALMLMRENGFTHMSDEKISNYKDGEEVYDTLSNIITALFDAGNMASEARFMLKVLALLDVKGMDREIIRDIIKFDMDMIHKLSEEGWLYDGNIIRLHPVISETIRYWSWDDILKENIEQSQNDFSLENKDALQDDFSPKMRHRSEYSFENSSSVNNSFLNDFCKMNDGTPIPYDVTVMKYLKLICDIYVSCDNEAQLKFLGKEAEKYTSLHPRHIIKALYHDLMGTYYDTCTHGIYVPYTKEEAVPIEHMIEEANLAVREMEQSKDELRCKFLPKLYMELAMILIRSTPDGGDEAADLLNRVHDMLEESEPEYSENRCYHNMITAWYYTLIEPDPDEMLYFAGKAADIAFKVFPTDIEIIDIIYIPAANCLFFHNDMQSTGNMLEHAVEICRNHPDELRYIDKLIDLKIFQLDAFIELKDSQRCRELLDEIERMNEAYREKGIFREIPPDTKKHLDELINSAN